MEFIKKNFLITGFIIFLTFVLGLSVYLAQRQTTIKSEAAGTTTVCNGDSSFCIWFDNLNNNDPVTYANQDMYAYVIGKNGDTNVKLQGENDGIKYIEVSGADIFSGAQCGHSDYSNCWRFTIPGSKILERLYIETFISDQAPAGRVAHSFTPTAVFGAPVAPTPPPPVETGSTTATGITLSAEFWKITPSPVVKSNGKWPQITIDVGANQANWKLLFRTPIGSCDKNSCGLNDWYTITSGVDDKTGITFTPDPAVAPGDHAFALYDGVGTLVAVQIVNFQAPAAGGPNGTGVIAEGSDVADCELVTINGQRLSTFPGIVIDNQYRVDMIMRNTRFDNATTAEWAPNYKIKFLGGPSALTELGIENAEFVLGKKVASGDQYPFTVLIKPKSAGTYSFKWQMYDGSGKPFGGSCQPDFTVFLTLPGSSPVPGSTTMPTATPTVSPTNSPNIQVQFRSANADTYELAVAGLESAGWISFSPTANSSFMLSQVILTNPQPGKAKFVAVQFRKGNAIDSNIIVKSILYLGAPPAITGSVNCEYSTDGSSTRVIINGQNFGAAGSVISGSSLAYKIESWNQTRILALFTGKIQGQFPIKVTTDQGQSVSSICQVGLTTVNFNLTTQCASVVQGGYNSDNVKVKIYKNVSDADVTQPTISQTIRVSAGQVQSFNPSLEANKDYSMLIKAPKSPQKRIDFKTQNGTSDLGTIVLRTGDIAPVNNPDGDGFINALDISELYRQWNIIRDVSGVGDVNGDSRVNSVDYSCIKQNYDASRGNETFSPTNTGTTGASGGSTTSNAINIATKGRVFLDSNANRLLDTGEVLVPNTSVQLLKVPDSHVVGQPLNSGELQQSTIFAQTTTDSSGAFTMNFSAVNQNAKVSFYVPASTGTNNSPGQMDGSGSLQSLNSLSTNIQQGGIDIPVPFVGTLNMNVSQL